MIATEDCRLLSLNWEKFKILKQQYPKIIVIFPQNIMRQLQKRELQETLFVSLLFQGMSQEALNALEQELELVTYIRGETIITQGEQSRSCYIIISGRLSISYQGSSKDEQVLIELTRCQSVGEIGIITSGKRTATVCAARDSLLARLSLESFDRLLQEHPQDMMKQFAGKIIAHLQQQTIGKHKTQHNTLNIAVFATDSNASVTDFTKQLVSGLDKLGKTLHLSADFLDYYLSPTGIGQTPLEDPNSINVARWLNHQESRIGLLFMRLIVTRVNGISAV